MRPEKYLVEVLEEISKEIYSEIQSEDESLPIHKVIPLLLFRKLIEKVDAICILVDNNSGDSALTISRGVLENYWYFMYMIEEDCEFRALSYYYFDKKNSCTKGLRELRYHEEECFKYRRKRIEDIEVLKSKSEFLEYSMNKNKHYTELYEMMKEISGVVMPEEILKNYKKQFEINEHEVKVNNNKIEKLLENVATLNEMLEQAKVDKKQYHSILERINRDPQLEAVRNEFAKAKKNNDLHNITWYTLKTNITSIRQLAKKINLDHEYSPYSSLSQETHVMNASSQIEVVEGDVLLSDLRNINMGKTALVSASLFLSYAIEPFLLFYGKESRYQEISKQMNQFHNN